MPALQLENALLRSGIDLEHPLGKYFVESYKGDQTDVEGLRAKAAELGVPFRVKDVPRVGLTPLSCSTPPTRRRTGR